MASGYVKKYDGKTFEELLKEKTEEYMLEELGGRLWERVGGNGRTYRRVYLNEPEWWDVVDASVTYYKTGNISNAWLNGEKISNCRARRELMGSIYFDGKQFHFTGGDASAANEVIDHIREKVGEILSIHCAVYEDAGDIAEGDSVMF